MQGYFYLWRGDGTWKFINHRLLMETRERQGRDASPNAGIIDSQSVKTWLSTRNFWTNFWLAAIRERRSNNPSLKRPSGLAAPE